MGASLFFLLYFVIEATEIPRENFNCLTVTVYEKQPSDRRTYSGVLIKGSRSTLWVRNLKKESLVNISFE